MDLPATISELTVVELLSDPRRLAILRLLMSRPHTLTQLARALDSYPARVRHHVKKLEAARLVELSATRISGGVVEKYYRAGARAYLINLAVYPQTAAVVLFGSDDPALARLAEQLPARAPQLLTLSVGSLDGLIALRQGVCQVAAAHLPDPAGGDFNVSYVRHIFPGRRMTLITLAYRAQGLLVAPGNPLRIREPADAARPDVRLVTRQPGAGTRVWLEQTLAAQAGLSPADVRGIEPAARTHFEAAAAVAEGRADAGVGVLAAASAFGLDFVPLFEERYELVLPAEEAGQPPLRPLLDHLQSAAGRRTIGALPGYDVARTGESRLVG